MSAINNVPNEGKELKTVKQEAIWALGGQVQFLRHETRKQHRGKQTGLEFKLGFQSQL